MKKITTLFVMDYSGKRPLITNEVRPENAWVYNESDKVRATIKYDGTACAIIKGVLYKRYDAKINKKTGEYKKPVPLGAIPCQDPDKVTGHHPHWILCDRKNNSDKYHFEAFDALLTDRKLDGTYELCGPKVNGNKLNISFHALLPHGFRLVTDMVDYSYEAIQEYLENTYHEGIVFHHEDGRMCKIRRKDFGLRW